MISVLCENGKIDIEMNGKEIDLLEEAGNMILELINSTGKTVEERHEFGVMLLSNVVGTFMQEQIDGEYDDEEAAKYIASAFRYITTNIILNKNKDKLHDLIREALERLAEPEKADKPETVEPAQEEAEKGCSDNE